MWDPVAVVCSYLNLAERAISKFGREVTGYSAQQMADRLRVRDVREALRAEAEAFVRKEQVVFHAWEDRTKNPVEAQWFLYKKWLAYKRERVNESNEVRALRFGFKYYARYKMACLMEFGMTPDGLEFAAFEELGLYYAAREALGGRVRSDHAKPYQDLWATLWRERREWLEGMKAAWGVEEFMEAHWRDE